MKEIEAIKAPAIICFFILDFTPFFCILQPAAVLIIGRNCTNSVKEKEIEGKK